MGRSFSSSLTRSGLLGAFLGPPPYDQNGVDVRMFLTHSDAHKRVGETLAPYLLQYLSSFTWQERKKAKKAETGPDLQIQFE